MVVDIRVILLSGAVGGFLALFLLLTLFWHSCAWVFESEYPNPVQFAVSGDLVETGDDSAANRDEVFGFQTALAREELTDPHWTSSWNEGLSAAQREGKPVLVVFRRDFYRWCNRMDQETFSSPEIRKRLEGDWICIRIDVSRSDLTGRFAGKTMTYGGMTRCFQVTGIPAALFIDRSGKPVQMVSGFLREDTFGALLDYMGGRVYERNVPFEEYRANLASAKR